MKYFYQLHFVLHQSNYNQKYKITLINFYSISLIQKIILLSPIHGYLNLLILIEEGIFFYLIVWINYFICCIQGEVLKIIKIFNTLSFIISLTQIIIVINLKNTIVHINFLLKILTKTIIYSIKLNKRLILTGITLLKEKITSQLIKRHLITEFFILKKISNFIIDLHSINLKILYIKVEIVSYKQQIQCNIVEKHHKMYLESVKNQLS